MKIQRSISIDADLWLQAKRLPSISKVIQEFLEEYLEYNKDIMKKEEINKKINELEENKRNLEVQILTLKNMLEENKNKEIQRKEKEIEEIQILNENKQRKDFIINKKLTIDEITYFKNNPEPKIITYNGQFNTDYNEEELLIRLNKYRERFEK